MSSHRGGCQDRSLLCRRGVLDPGVGFVLVRCWVSGQSSRSIRCPRNAIGQRRSALPGAGTILPSGPRGAIASFGAGEGHSLSVGSRRMKAWTRTNMDAHLRTGFASAPRGVGNRQAPVRSLGLRVERSCRRSADSFGAVDLLVLPHAQGGRRDLSSQRELGQVGLDPVLEHPTVIGL